MSAPERSISGEIRAQVHVRADSRWFSGHFPNFPVLPAIAQVNMVVAMVTKATGTSLYLKKASRIKFKRLVAPDCTLTLQAMAEAELNQYKYRISEGEDEVSSGTLILANKV